MAEITRSVAVQAGSELADLIGLLIDDVPNKEQLGEVVQAAAAVLTVARTEIPEDKRVAVAMNVLEGIIGGLNTKVARFQLS